MMYALRICSLAIALASLAACGPAESDPAPAPEPDAAVPDATLPDEPEPEPEPAGAFTLALAKNKLPILQGTRATLAVTIERSEGFAEPIRLSAANLPAGVSMKEVLVAADADEAELELSAPASAPHSLPTAVAIKGVADSASDEQELTVTVYGPPGSLDTSFAGGKVVVPAGAGDDYGRALAVAADGKILIAGQSAENLGDFALLRLTRDGELDTSFGRDGVVSTQVGKGSDIAYAVAVQKDGKIVVAGNSAGETTGLDFALVRYNADGSLDQDFGEGGKVTTSFGPDSDTAYALLIQEDGKIVLGGESNQSATGVDFALARYNPDGSLDQDFGDGGKVLTPVSANSARDTIYALATQVVDGETTLLAAGGEGDFKAARYHEDGSLDASFGSSGTLEGMLGSTIGTARAIAPAADGTILIAGHHTHDFALVRVREDGTPDASFGEGGRVVTALSDNWDEATGLALEADGKIVLGGWVYAGAGSNGDFSLVRYTEDGALDGDFGEGGSVITELSAPMRRDEAAAILLQSDERVPTVRVLLAGSASVASNSDFAIARYWR